MKFSTPEDAAKFPQTDAVRFLAENLPQDPLPEGVTPWDMEVAAGKLSANVHEQVQLLMQFHKRFPTAIPTPEGWMEPDIEHLHSRTRPPPAHVVRMRKAAALQ